MRSICSVHLRFTRVACQVVVGPRVGSTEQNRMRTDKHRTGNTRVPNETHAQRTITVQPADAFGRCCPFQVLSTHKTFRRMERTSPDKERIRRTRNGQETHANGYEGIENVAVCWKPVSFFLQKPLLKLRNYVKIYVSEPEEKKRKYNIGRLAKMSNMHIIIWKCPRERIIFSQTGLPMGPC